MRNTNNSQLLQLGGFALVLGGVGLVLVAFWSAVTVQAGHIGVLNRFGRVDPAPLDSGLHLVAPWTHVEQLSVRTQEIKETMSVPTREGLTVVLESSLLFSLEPSLAAQVFETIGPDYVNVFVIPQFRSAVRGITVGFEAKGLYTGSRAEIEEKIEESMRTLLQHRGIKVEKLLMRKIELPPTVQAAIELKMASEQKSQAMEYEILTAKKEAERRRIEAQSTSDSQKIIQETLNETYIRYLWVQALDTAAKNHTATIYVPTGNDGLPLMTPVKESTLKTAK